MTEFLSYRNQSKSKTGAYKRVTSMLNFRVASQLSNLCYFSNFLQKFIFTIVA